MADSSKQPTLSCTVTLKLDILGGVMSLDNPPGLSQGQSQPDLPIDSQKMLSEKQIEEKQIDCHREKALPTPTLTQTVMNGKLLRVGECY